MPNVIKASAIMNGLSGALSPDGTTQINWDKPVTTYLHGGPGIFLAFVHSLNSKAPFSGWHLNMQPADVVGVSTMRDWLTAIIKWLKDHGYTVEP